MISGGFHEFVINDVKCARKNNGRERSNGGRKKGY